MSEPLENPDRNEQFVLLFAEHEVDLRSYVLALLPRWDDAREVMQQVSLLLWRKFDQFDGGEDPHRAFIRWGCQIADYEVLNFRRKRQRDRLLFSDELLQTLADTRLAHQDGLELRREALARCLGRLSTRDRELIARRYVEGAKAKDLAAERGQPADTIYKALRQIRLRLHECINRTLRMGERS